jgi:hypothetical protein
VGGGGWRCFESISLRLGGGGGAVGCSGQFKGHGYKGKMSSSWNSTNNAPVPGRIWPMARDKEVTPAVKHQFYYT